VLEQLLEPDRAARLITFADRQSNALTLPDVLEAVIKATWGASDQSQSAMMRSLRRGAERVALDAMMMLGAHANATPDVRAVVLNRLTQLRTQLTSRRDSDAVTEAHIRQAERDLARYLENPTANAPKSSALPQPPGAPLGGPR
jgi:hypothetical protein